MAGLTNRLLGRIVKAAFTAFPEAAGNFPRGKVQQLGNPIRRQLLDNFMRPSGRPRAARACWSSAARRGPTPSTCG